VLVIRGMDTIPVECLPGDIPGELVADMSKLETLGDVITVADLPVPEDVVVLADSNAPVIGLTIEARDTDTASRTEGRPSHECLSFLYDHRRDRCACHRKSCSACG